MKVVLIHGQNHKGSSYHIGRMIADKMQGTNEITEFFLPRDLNHFVWVAITALKMMPSAPFTMIRERLWMP